MALREIALRINGREYRDRAEPRKTLADFIRDCGLTGTHLGCEHGVCGACTILMNGEAVRSCLLFAVQAEGADLMTVEGLSDGERLHPLQQAFWENHALQCGFCTPGFLMTTLAFLRETPHPTDRDIREALAGNLCRCTGYQNIITAVSAAAEALRRSAVGAGDARRIPRQDAQNVVTLSSHIVPLPQGWKAPEAKKVRRKIRTGGSRARGTQSAGMTKMKKRRAPRR